MIRLREGSINMAQTIKLSDTMSYTTPIPIATKDEVDKVKDLANKLERMTRKNWKRIDNCEKHPRRW